MRLFSADSTVLPADITLPENQCVIEQGHADEILMAVAAMAPHRAVMPPLRILLAKGCVETRTPRVGIFAVIGAATHARQLGLPVGLWHDLEVGHAWAGILGDQWGWDRWESIILAIRSLDPECDMNSQEEYLLNDILAGLAEPPPVEALPGILSHPDRRVRDWALKLVEIAV